MHYVLKHSMVVLMTARDESTSFKIFSTLNGRGVDLAVIDKLKPELLQVCVGSGRGGGVVGTRSCQAAGFGSHITFPANSGAGSTVAVVNCSLLPRPPVVLPHVCSHRYNHAYMYYHCPHSLLPPSN